MQIIYPLDEEILHELESTLCKCEPKIDFINGEMLLIHNAFDRRQFEEQIKEILENDSTETQ